MSVLYLKLFVNIFAFFCFFVFGVKKQKAKSKPNLYFQLQTYKGNSANACANVHVSCIKGLLKR